MTLVVDATVVTSALIDAGPEGAWSAEQLARGPLAAPHHMPVEVASVLRRAALHGEVPPGLAALALQDLLDLRIEFFPSRRSRGAHGSFATTSRPTTPGTSPWRSRSMPRS